MIRQHPLMRAVRADKLAYAALEGTLLEYAAGRAEHSVPVAAMIAAGVDALQARAARIVERVAATAGLRIAVADGESVIGGGTTPGLTIPSCLLDVRVEGHSPDTLDRLLRQADPPVVGRIEQERLLLDLRTVQPGEDAALAAVLAGIAAS